MHDDKNAYNYFPQYISSICNLVTLETDGLDNIHVIQIISASNTFSFLLTCLCLLSACFGFNMHSSGLYNPKYLMVQTLTISFYTLDTFSYCHEGLFKRPAQRPVTITRC